jgi:hypothetical protein
MNEDAIATREAAEQTLLVAMSLLKSNQSTTASFYSDKEFQSMAPRDAVDYLIELSAEEALVLFIPFP